MRRALFVALLAATLLCTASGGGGREIEGCLFVIAMAVDPAQDGNLTVTVKALSGTQEAAAPQESGQDDASDGGTPSAGQMETAEPGYVTMSATADSCLAALNLLSATTPRSVDLSQLREIVLSETLARTDATLTILRQIDALYEANGSAVVVVTPDDAGDFIRRQYAIFGVRLSQYLEVLFDHFAQLGTIPATAKLSSVLGAMESSTADAAAVYAAGNAFDAPLVLNGAPQTDRLPGHLPRTSPAKNEYLGSAVFSGTRMVGTLTGDETAILRMISGQALNISITMGEALYQISVHSRTRRTLDWENGAPVLGVRVVIRMALSAGVQQDTAAELGRQLEADAAQLLLRLQAMGSDPVGYGRLAVRRYADIPAWEQSGWADAYRSAAVRVAADVHIQ